MKTILLPLLLTLSGLVRSRTRLHLENLALRQQLAMITHRDSRRFRFRRRERLFWVWFYRLWPDCLHTLRIFSPDTLLGWHRKGFRLYWGTVKLSAQSQKRWEFTQFPVVLGRNLGAGHLIP